VDWKDGEVGVKGRFDFLRESLRLGAIFVFGRELNDAFLIDVLFCILTKPERGG
jgi:hypothetical protein